MRCHSHIGSNWAKILCSNLTPMHYVFFLCCFVCYMVKDSSLRSFKRRMHIIILGIGYWVEHLCCNDIESLMPHLNLLLWLLFGFRVCDLILWLWSLLLQEEIRENLNHQRINSIVGGDKRKLEPSKNQFYCRRRLEKTWTIKESILLQEEIRENLKHQRINSIARGVQKKLEASKNQVYRKTSEKTWIIKESSLLQEFRKNFNHQRINSIARVQKKLKSSKNQSKTNPKKPIKVQRKKRRKKRKTRQEEEEDDDEEGMQV